MSYTPGPWEIDPRASTRVRQLGTDRGICSTGGHADNMRDVSNENDANARLIAAAPDLLAALKDAREKLRGAVMWLDKLDGGQFQAALAETVDYDGTDTDGCGLTTDLENAMDRSDAAIDKAEGR